MYSVPLQVIVLNEIHIAIRVITLANTPEYKINFAHDMPTGHVAEIITAS